MSNFRYLTNGKNNNIVLVVCKDYDTLSMKAAQIIAAQVNQKPDCILGLATGSSPVGLYKKLIERSHTLPYNNFLRPARTPTGLR